MRLKLEQITFVNASNSPIPCGDLLKRRHVGGLLPAKLLERPTKHRLRFVVVRKREALTTSRVFRDVVDALHVILTKGDELSVLLNANRV